MELHVLVFECLATQTSLSPQGKGLLELTKIGHPSSCAVEDLKELGMSNSKFGKYVYAVSNFYAAYHKEAYDIDGTFQTKH